MLRGVYGTRVHDVLEVAGSLSPEFGGDEGGGRLLACLACLPGNMSGKPYLRLLRPPAARSTTRSSVIDWGRTPSSRFPLPRFERGHLPFSEMSSDVGMCPFEGAASTIVAGLTTMPIPWLWPRLPLLP